MYLKLLSRRQDIVVYLKLLSRHQDIVVYLKLPSRHKDIVVYLKLLSQEQKIRKTENILQAYTDCRQHTVFVLRRRTSLCTTPEGQDDEKDHDVS